MESWQSKQLVYTINITKRGTTTPQLQPKFRGQSLPRSVSFRSYQGEKEEENIYNKQEIEAGDRDKSGNAMKDLLLIGERTSGRQQIQVQPAIKCNNQIEEAKNCYHHYSEAQQNQHYDSNNNSNNNGFNSSKVKLLITPAAGRLPEVCGSKQQMALSSQNTISCMQASYNNDRSQQQQSRQKNYHHYDYYTDSELTSSQKEVQQQQLNHHDQENILLFATEHENSNTDTKQSYANGNYRQRAGVTPETTQQPPSQQQVPPVNNSTRAKSATHHHNQYSSFFYNNNVPQTGKFVNYYPSWRQTQSPTKSYHQNYSFHVPLMQQQYHLNQQPLYQPRYSFVAPIERIYVTPGGRFKQSFKSQTISHIPNMVRVSVEETTGERKTKAAIAVASTDNNDSFENYYDKPQPAVNKMGDVNTNKCFIKSEGDLLKAHVIDLRHDKGYDNPFKPGTELSWEAEMMVRLIKRGYPIQELPVLVETAKHLAKERQKTKASLNKTDSKTKEGARNNDDEMLNESITTTKLINKVINNQSNNLSPPPLTTSYSAKKRNNQKSENIKLRRQSSQSDLSSGKQVWANSLSRTKSMPRFSNYSSQRNIDYEDIDSLDKLITSIENEMADLVDGSESEADDKKRLIKETIGNQNEREISTKVQERKELQSRRILDSGSGSANIKINKQKRSEVKSNNNDNNDNNVTLRKQPDLNRMKKSKNKKSGRQCCIIQ